MSEIEFLEIFILLLIGVLMIIGKFFILKSLSNIVEELKKLNQNKDE
jgi:hypothetical protein